MKEHKYKGWSLLDELPTGWKFDKTAGSPLCGYEFATNGRSILTGLQKKALVRIAPPQKNFAFDESEDAKIDVAHNAKEEPEQVIDAHYVRTVNELARQKFKQRLLADIMTDLMICEIEGWAKIEYINELRRLLNDIGKGVCIDA